MKLWLVIFYIREFKPFQKTRPKRINVFLTIQEPYTEYKEVDKEIHRYIVDSEEKADLLVEAFTSTTTSAKKIELVG